MISVNVSAGNEIDNQLGNVAIKTGFEKHNFTSLASNIKILYFPPLCAPQLCRQTSAHLYAHMINMKDLGLTPFSSRWH